MVRKIMEDYSRQRHEAAGYEFVNSPHITKSELFEISGHLDWFADGMFPPMELDGGTKYYLKPMNCPFHILIFRSRTRSYRELPLRMFEFGGVYRYEKSGVVHGLTRVRGMTQDDAHIFTTREQMTEEIAVALALRARPAARLTGSPTSTSSCRRSRRARRSEPTPSGTKPPRRCASRRSPWDSTSCSTRAAARSTGRRSRCRRATRSVAPGSSRRSSSTSSCRSGSICTTSRADNERKRPVMIHRALFGSIERFFGVLVEHYAGAFPVWLAPVQVSVLPVADRHDPYAFRIVDRLKSEGFRAEMLDGSGGGLGKRIGRSEAREGAVRARRRRQRRRVGHRRCERARRRRARTRRSDRHLHERLALDVAERK